MSGPSLRHLRPADLAPYVEGLRALEQGIRYPLDETQHFTIDHGAHYHPFFSQLGEAHFLLAVDGEDVVGTVAGVRKEALLGERVIPALYIADLKLRQDFRGRGLARRMCLRGLYELLRGPDLRRARLLYGAAMRGRRGDVMRTARGGHPFRLGRPLATLRVWFAEPAALAALEPGSGPEAPAPGGWDLSHTARDEGPGVRSTAGSKDLRLASDGTPLPLHHLPRGPRAWGPGGIGPYLRACGEWLVARGATGKACFALDERLEREHRWLGERGLPPDTVCTVYALALPPATPRAPWVHLATSEI